MKTGQPDLEASEIVISLSTPHVVEKLVDILGARLVAYLAAVKDVRAVREWATGDRPIKNPAVPQRLRNALRVALFLSEIEGRETVQAWFQGLNPQLDERVPLDVLLEADTHERPAAEVAAVIAAAREFASR